MLKLKTFRAATMHEALELVKRSLGPRAMILHTRTFREGGLFGMFSRTVVEITASDQPVRAGEKPRPKRQSRSAERVEPMAGDLIRRTYAAAAAELGRGSKPARGGEPEPRRREAHGVNGDRQPPVRRGAGGPNAPVDQATVTDLSALPPGQLAEELDAVKRMVAQVMRYQRDRLTCSGGAASAGGSGGDDPLFQHYLALLEREVAEDLADEVIDRVRGDLGRDQLKDREAVREAVLRAVADLIPTDPDSGSAPRRHRGRPRTVALIGPTGVGKTTTIAKLAATYKLKHKKKVGLITADTYRIAAVEQLRTYADIIGVPLHVVTSPEEMVEALSRCAGCDVVLIDTAGRGQRDTAKLESLGLLLRAADPQEVHLVLSSTCSKQVLIDTVERFSPIPTDRIIFTKLDEAVSLGVLITVARKVNKRLSFITTGQEVPNQIEPGCPARLASLVLGEGVGGPC